MYTRPPVSSSHILIFRTLAARDSASFSVSPGAMAAKTRTPLPMDDTSSLSTVTEADRTRCRMAETVGGAERRESREGTHQPFILAANRI